MNLPVQDLSGKSGVLADATIEDFHFENEKSYVDRIYTLGRFLN